MSLAKKTSKKDKEFLIEFLIGCHYLGKDMGDELALFQDELAYFNDSDELKPLREHNATQIFAMGGMIDALESVKYCVWDGVAATRRAALKISKQFNSSRPEWVKAEKEFAPHLLNHLQEILEYKP
jgi:hypothetical protein